MNKNVTVAEIVTKLQALESEEVWEEKKLLFAAERSMALVKAYCGIEVVPNRLEGVCISLAGQLYERGIWQNGYVKQLQEGNVSVTWENELTEKELLSPFVEELQRVRKLQW